MTLAIFIGFIIGILGGLLGVGGGAMMVAASVLFLGVPQQVAQAVGLVAMIPIALSGAVKHHRNRLINYRLGVLIAIGGMLGGIGGAYLANVIPEIWLKRMFSLFFGLMSIQMFWSSFKTSEKAQKAGDQPAGEQEN